MRKILQPLMLAVIALCITACRGKEDYGLCILSDEVSVETNSQRFFPMHSVVKFPQALYVADYLNSIEFSLDSTTVVRKDELMEDTWSPMLEMIEDAREFSFRELLRLSLTESDNNACDLLFKLCGNPREVESYIKGLGFEGIEVSATERQMHDDISLSSQNRCTPSGMARLFLWFNAHKDDNEYIREVWDIMAECKTGTDRIPACFVDNCKIIHKTGTGFSPENGLPQMNDAGIVVYPNGQVLALAVFVPHPSSAAELAEILKGSLK